MPSDTAAPLQCRAKNRVTARRATDIQRRTESLRLRRRQPFIVDALQTVGMHVTPEHLHVVMGVRQHQNAARRIHDVVVQRLRQAFPQLQRVLVKRRAFGRR